MSAPSARLSASWSAPAGVRCPLRAHNNEPLGAIRSAQWRGARRRSVLSRASARSGFRRIVTALSASDGKTS